MKSLPLGLLLGVAAAASCCRGDADFSDAMPPVVTLRAEDYQAEIMEIDRLVFDDAPFTKERREALSGRVEALAARIPQGSDSKFLKLEALELRRLAGIAKHLPSEPPPAALANDWMRLRNNLFEDRAWMARSAADLEPARRSAAAGR